MTTDLDHVRGALLRSLLALTPTLQRQFGVLAVGQAEDAGVARQRLAELCRTGLLERVRTGIYRATLYPPSWEAAWMGQLLAAGPDAVISGRAAAYLHDLRFTWSGARPDLELTVPRRGRRRRSGPAVVTELNLLAGDTVRSGPWRLTSVAWTLCSLAYVLGLERFEKAVDAAVAGGRVTIEELGRTATRFRYCTGIPVIREVLQRHDPRVRLTRSEAERLFLRALRRAGLPPPEVDHRVTDADGHRRYLDFAYPPWRIMIEIDVFGDHLRTIGRHHDGHRQNALVGEWTPLRFDELDLRYDLDRVVQEVRRALRDAGAVL